MSRAEMDIVVFLQHSERGIAFVAGVAGAAAMAATDWRSPWRVVQHLFVGTCAATFATPIFAPAISKALGWIAVDPGRYTDASAFIVGAFAIYVLELGLAIYRHKIAKLRGDA